MSFTNHLRLCLLARDRHWSLKQVATQIECSIVKMIMYYEPGLTIKCFPCTHGVAKLKFQLQHMSVKSCNISVIYVQRVTLASQGPVILL